MIVARRGVGCGCGCAGNCGCNGLQGVGQLTATSMPTFSFTTAPAGSLTIAGFDASFLENTLALFGYAVPVWMLAAGAAVVGMTLLGGSAKRGRRR